jgi:hypothetical protein
MRRLFTKIVLITMTVLSVPLESPAANAQIVKTAKSSGSTNPTMSSPPVMRNTRLAGDAPIGHRQPRTRDVPSENPNSLEHISPEDAAVDRKLVICRRC